MPSIAQIFNRDAKGRHLKYTTGHIASPILTLVEFVFGQHEILKLIGGIHCPGVLSGIRVGLETCPLVLEGIYHLDVKFIALNCPTCKIPALKVVIASCLLNCPLNFLWSN